MSALTDKLLAKSWYREPWPWLLMSGPAIVIVAGFYTLWLAIQSDDGLVADDYYKRGLAINQTLSRAQRAEQLALVARVEFGGDSARIRARLTGAKISLPPVLRLRLVHPTQAVADQVIELRAVAPGEYEGTRVAAAAGRRVVMLEDFERTWRLAGEASSGAQTLLLAPQ
jgi:hypothetical protein